MTSRPAAAATPVIGSSTFIGTSGISAATAVHPDGSGPADPA
jgi:hypothetical protein